MKKPGRDYKMIIGMTLLILLLLIMAAGFWITVAKQAVEEKKIQEAEEAGAITAIYVETDGLLRMQVFIDMDRETIFTAPTPSEGIYGEDGKLSRDSSLTSGDIVRIYGNGIMTRSFPGQYPGVTKIQKTGHADEKELESYKALAESFLQGTQDFDEIPESASPSPKMEAGS